MLNSFFEDKLVKASENQEYVLEQRFESAAKETLSVLKSIWHTFTYGRTDVINNKKFYISGGFIPNYMRFQLDAAGRQSRMSFSQYTKTDLDVWVRADTEKEYKEIVKPLLNKYKNEMRDINSDYAGIKHGKSINSYSIPHKGEFHLVTHINLIHIQYGEPKEIIESFDFEHLKAYFECGTQTLIVPPKVVDLLKRKATTFTKNRMIAKYRYDKWKNRNWAFENCDMRLVKDEKDIPKPKAQLIVGCSS